MIFMKYPQPAAHPGSTTRRKMPKRFGKRGKRWPTRTFNMETQLSASFCGLLILTRCKLLPQAKWIEYFSRGPTFPLRCVETLSQFHRGLAASACWSWFLVGLCCYSSIVSLGRSWATVKPRNVTWDMNEHKPYHPTKTWGYASKPIAAWCFLFIYVLKCCFHSGMCHTELFKRPEFCKRVYV